MNMNLSTDSDEQSNTIFETPKNLR